MWHKCHTCVCPVPLSLRCFTDLSRCANGFTLAVWLYLGRVIPGQHQYIVSSGHSNNGQTAQFNLKRIDGPIFVEVKVKKDSAVTQWTSGGIDVVENKWFHLATTWTGKVVGRRYGHATRMENGYLKVYVDGTLQTTDQSRSSPASVGVINSSMHIGKLNSRDDNYANVTLDELHVWAYDQSETEIRQSSDLSQIRGEPQNSTRTHLVN